MNLAETTQRAAGDTYPAYPDEISITAEQNVVTIEGTKAQQAEREYLYRGISTRQFNLADYVQVKGAAFDKGLLKLSWVREISESMKPRRIAIMARTTSQRKRSQHRGQGGLIRSP